jgi:serpin B
MTEDRPLMIGSVLQKARLILDEEGTHAAAATMMSMEACGLPRPEEVVEFRMDHPFVFVIADETSGAVCFAGIVANPVGN